MFHKFNAEAKASVQRSIAAARAAGHSRSLPGEYLLVGLLQTAVVDGDQAVASEGDQVREIFQKLGITAAPVLAWLEGNVIPQADGANTPTVATSHLSEYAANVLKYANEKFAAIGPASIARALFNVPSEVIENLLRDVAQTNTAAVRAAFAEPNAPETPRPQPRAPRGGMFGHPDEDRESETEFYTDMVALAREKESDPVVGREAVLMRTMQILARRTKNNPVLVGEPGVGKTAVVEALAAAIAANEVPEVIAGRPLWSVDLAGMLAGTRYRGDFEERIKGLLTEAKKQRAIMFIDEIHCLVGAGAGGGAMDAAQMMKEELARGEITLIGATTFTEYKQHIMKDAALDRRFSTVEVAEPTLEHMEEIMDRIAPAYAEYHKVTYTPAALKAVVRLADRYVRDRYNPDKSIDVLDEAGARRAMAVSRDSSLSGEIDEEYVAEIVSAMTGIPCTNLNADQISALRDLEESLSAQVVGQPTAVQTVARTIRRNRVGLGAVKRPSSFLFAGPTGVGKTEITKALATQLYGVDPAARGNLLTFDMSEFGEKHSVARLFGAPPGYVGFEAGGELTEAIRRNPASVLLLDEIDKAHPEIFDALLQVLEEGRLTDGQGRSVDFSDTIVVMTTNFGAREAAATSSLGFATAKTAASNAASTTMRVLKENFRPEFLNRIDEIVVFNPLESHMLEAITTKFTDELVLRAAESGVQLEVTPSAITALTFAGTSLEFGARPLRRVVEQTLTDQLTDFILMGISKNLVADTDENGTVVVKPATVQAESVVDQPADA